MNEIIEFLTPFSDFIKIIGGILAGCIALYKTLQKFFAKEIDGKLQILGKDLEQLSEDMKSIKTINEQQNDKMQELKTCQDQMRIAEKNLLRTILINKFYEYKDKEYLPYYEREGLAFVYQDYKSLDGNSFIDHLYEEITRKKNSTE